jgi:hypothetical protein
MTYAHVWWRRAAMCSLLSVVGLFGCDDGGGDGSASDGDSGAGGAADAGVWDAEPTPDPDAAPMVPDIHVEPSDLALVALAGATSAPATVTIRNQGLAGLTVDSIVIEGDGAFSLGTPFAGPATVEAGGRIEVEVTYTAPDDTQHAATLVVTSDDADEPEVRIPLVGRAPMTCFRTTPDRVDIGVVEFGVLSGRFRIEVRNCGDDTVTVDGIGLDGDEGFEWAGEGAQNPIGRALAPGDVLRIGVRYRNDALEPDQMAAATLQIITSVETIEVPVTARGGAGAGCQALLRPERIEFGTIRIGTSATEALELVNLGRGDCEIRDIGIEQDRGNPANVFRVAEGPDSNVLGPLSTITVLVEYAPEMADPAGDRYTLNFDFKDVEADMNGRVSMTVGGVGARALVGEMPVGGGRFHQTTAERCASLPVEVHAENIGFVPICITGWRIEGDDCDSFPLLSAPEPIEPGGCMSLEAGERATFEFQFEPARVGQHICNIVATADAQNREELPIQLLGPGVEMDATERTFFLENPNRNRRLDLDLDRPTTEDTITVRVNDAVNEDWQFDPGRNSVFFDRGSVPMANSTVVVDYAATCFPRQ